MCKNLYPILIVPVLGLLAGCLFIAPDLPKSQPGKALLVMGFSTELTESYEGGILYSGFVATRLDGQELKPALRKSQLQVIEPGPHRLSGNCYWRLRATMAFQDDLMEPGTLEWTAKAGVIYTVGSQIDEYKLRCEVSTVEKAWE